MSTNFKVTDTPAGWNQTDFEDLFVRKDCFLEGGLWLWGSSFSGQLGNSSTVSQSSPVQTISGGTNWKNIGSDGEIIAIKTDGTLWNWGFNFDGQLGNECTTNQSSPVQTVSNGTDWRSLSAGGGSGAIKTDGSLWLWGSNSAGRLGDDSITRKSSPVQTISGGTNWRSISSRGTTAAIKTDGTLWTWGSTYGGRLGNNCTASNASSPVQTISGGTNWRSVIVGNSSVFAIKTDGTLWGWGGSLGYGVLGNNGVGFISSPVQTISGGTNWKSVSFSCTHTSAIKTDGTLWLWGDGASGGLGNHCTTNQSSPVQTISGGTNWRSVAVGFRVTAAIKTDGTLWTWGNGACGSLGNSCTTNQSSPVQTISGGTNWRKIFVPSLTTIAIREDCW